MTYPLRHSGRLWQFKTSALYTGRDGAVAMSSDNGLVGTVFTSQYRLIFKLMNECLTTPQHEKHIGYWVSVKGKCNEMVMCFFSLSTFKGQIGLLLTTNLLS